MTSDPFRPLAAGRARPAYRQIEDQLHDLIRAETLRPGDRMPPERDLARRFGVSRMTLRQALDALVRRGLLARNGRRGTFVAAPKVEQDLRVLRSYPDELHGQGRAASTRLLGRNVVAAPARVAAALRLPAGACVIELERLRSADGLPFVAETSWLPAELFPVIGAGFRDGSLWDAMSVAGHTVARAIERLEPVVAGPAEAALLHVAEGSPLMLVERTSFDRAGRPLEFAVATTRGDRATFIVEVPATDSRQ